MIGGRTAHQSVKQGASRGGPGPKEKNPTKGVTRTTMRRRWRAAEVT
jgi:hypothetical protein